MFHCLNTILIFFLIAGTVLFEKKLSFNWREANIPPPNEIKHFTFGYSYPMADSFWIRALQDFDYCEQTLTKQGSSLLPPGQESQKAHQQTAETAKHEKTASEENIVEKVCSGSGWLYQILELVTDLSPDFRMAFSAGGLALTIVISDIEGASKFFNKAVKFFPNDVLILMRAAYHAIYEEKDNVKAAGLVKRAADNGGASWFYSLATRLYTDGGKKELAMEIYKQEKEKNLDENILKRMREKIGIKEEHE